MGFEKRIWTYPIEWQRAEPRERSLNKIEGGTYAQLLLYVIDATWVMSRDPVSGRAKL